MKAFTLIELLIVLLIVSLIMGLVAPRGAKLLDSFNSRIEKKRKADLIKEDTFKCFLYEKNNSKLGINKNGIKI